MQILIDNPTKKDQLGFDQYVEILVNILKEVENLPLTIWGQYKCVGNYVEAYEWSYNR